MEADKDRDGKISFEEFTKMVENTDVSMSMTLGKLSIWPLPLSFVHVSPHSRVSRCLSRTFIIPVRHSLASRYF